jgi:threonine dehydrogenase-like Zn-dependent dehydrogenase
MEQAWELVEAGGSVLFFAPLPPGATLEFPAHELWQRGVTIVHSYSGPPADMRTALDLIAARRVDVASMITHRLALDEIATGFRLMLAAGESLKILVEP